MRLILGMSVVALVVLAILSRPVLYVQKDYSSLSFAVADGWVYVIPRTNITNAAERSAFYLEFGGPYSFSIAVTSPTDRPLEIRSAKLTITDSRGSTTLEHNEGRIAPVRNNSQYLGELMSSHRFESEINVEYETLDVSVELEICKVQGDCSIEALRGNITTEETRELRSLTLMRIMSV